MCQAEMSKIMDKLFADHPEMAMTFLIRTQADEAWGQSSSKRARLGGDAGEGGDVPVCEVGLCTLNPVDS